MAGIKIELQLQDGSFTSGMLRAGQSLKSFKSELERLDPHYRKLADSGQAGFQSFKKMEDGSRSLLGRLRDITVVAGGVSMAFNAISGAGNGLVGNIVNINAEMERLRFQLAGMSHAADPMKDAANQVRELQNTAKNAPFSFKELTNTFVKLKVSGLDPMNGSLQSLIDGIAAFGGNDEALHRITLGITQMSGKGVIQMEELRQQLGESMPAAMKLMARSMGVSLGELTKLITTGRVESKAALDSWFREVDLSYGGAASQMMKTFSGQMARIRTIFTQRVTEGEMGKAFEQLKATMGDIVTMLESPQAAEFFDSLGRGMQSTLKLARELFGALLNMRDTLVQWGPTVLKAMAVSASVSAIGKLVNAVNALKVAGLGITQSFQAAGRSIQSFNKSSLAAQQVVSGVEAAQILLSRNRVTKSVTTASARSAVSSSKISQAAGRGNNADEYLARAGEAATVLASLNAQEVELRKRMNSTTALTGSLAGRATKGIAGAIGPVVAGLGRALGLLGPIGLAIGVMAPLVWEVGKGIWNWATGAREAAKEVQKTLKDVKKANAGEQKKDYDDLLRRQAEEMRIATERRDRTASGYSEYFDRYGKDNPQQLRMLDLAQKNVDDMLAKHEEQRTALAKKHAAIREKIREEAVNSEVADIRAQISENTQQSRKEYNSRMDVLAAAREAAEASVSQNGGSIRAVREQGEEWTKRFQRDRVESIRNETQAQIEAAQKRVDAGLAEAEVVEILREDLKKLNQELEEIDSRKLGVKLLTAPEDDTKKIQRLVNFVESAKDKSKELAVELSGASGAVGKLLYQIKRGDFGNLKDGTREAEFFRYELLEATIAAEALQNMLDRKTSFLNGINGEIDKLQKDIDRWEAAQKFGLDEDDPTLDLRVWLDKFETGTADVKRTAEENVVQALKTVTEGTNGALLKFEDLNSMLAQKAFGEENQKRISDAAGQMERMARAAGALTEALGSADFSNLPSTEGWVGNSIVAPGLAFGNSIQDFVRKVIGVESGGKADAKNPNSSATGGAQFIDSTWLKMISTYRPDLAVGRSKEQVLALRENMAISKEMTGHYAQENAAHLNKNGFAATAGNLYLSHFAGSGGAVKALGAAPGASVARVLGESVVRSNPFLKGWSVQNLIDWASNKMGGVRAATTFSALTSENQQVMMQGGQAMADAGNAAYVKGKDTLLTHDEMMRQKQMKVAMDDLSNDLKLAAESDEDPTIGQTVKKLTEAILDGKLDPKDRDINSDQYKPYFEKARKADELRASTKEQRKAEAEIMREEEKLQERQLELAQQIANTRGKTKDPNYRERSKEMLELDKTEADYLDAVKRRYGEQSDEYAKAVQKMKDVRKQLTTAEGAEAFLTLKTSREAAENAVMTESERRKKDLSDEMDAAAAKRDIAIQSGEDRVRVEEEYQRTIAAIRKKYQTDLQTQAIGMMDIHASIKGVASAMPKQLSEALYTQDWTSFGDAVREGIARSLTDAAAGALMKNIFGSLLEGEDGEGGIAGMISGWVSKLPGMITKETKDMGGAGAGGGGFFASIFKAITGIFTKGATGTAHTGAIIGLGGGGRTMASVANFIGAPKYHTGGIVGKSLGISAGLRRDEVPIIAKKKEGVFTPEQMKHLGGTMLNSQSISISPVINMNAQGGSPEANADLAKQTARETEAAMRGLVRDELIKQFRTGNMLAGR